MIETPLVLELISDWDASYTVEGDESYLSCRTREGVKILYQQIVTGEKGDGTTSCIEFVTFQKGKVEFVENVHVMSVKGENFIVREGRAREYYSPTFSLSDAVKHVLSDYVRDEFADRFADGFYSIFTRLRQSDYDHIMILRDNDFVYLGDSRFLDVARGEEDLKKGLKKAYILQHSEGVTRNRSVESIDEVVKGLPKYSSSVILTSRDPALKLVGSPYFDEDPLQRFSLYMNEMLFAVPEFIDGLLSENIYEFLAGRFGVSKESVLEAVSAAEGSRVVRHDDQLRELKRSMEVGEEELDKAITIEEEILLGDITAELTEYSAELMIYREYDWWRKLREISGMVFDGSMDDARQRSRRSDWIRRVSDVFDRCYDTIAGMHYDSLLHISPRRIPCGRGAWKDERLGVGNMVLDLGSSDVFHELQADVVGDGLDRLRAYLFRGEILKPVLTRKMPGDARVVVVDTCAERVHELARFCVTKEVGREIDRHTLVYRFHRGGATREVELVMANREAQEEVGVVRKKDS